jgi:hypothetical protein
MELMILLLGAVVGWGLGTAWATMLAHKTIYMMLREFGITDDQVKALARKKGIKLPSDSDSAEEDPVLTHIEIRIEKIDDQLLAYSIHDNKFLGQGRDREELIASLTANLTNVRITISEDNGSNLIKP